MAIWDKIDRVPNYVLHRSLECDFADPEAEGDKSEGCVKDLERDEDSHGRPIFPVDDTGYDA